MRQDSRRQYPISDSKRKLCNRVENIFTERNDLPIWSRKLERHFDGSYSYACVRARPRRQLEFSHLELGSKETFVGIYDGHNGSKVASHAYENLFYHLTDNILRERIVDEEKMTQAVDAMENQIIALSREDITQKFATVGSCYLIVLIYKDLLYVRNLGDKKYVLGRKYGSTFVTDQVNDVDNLQDEPVTKCLEDNYLKYDDCAVQAPDLVRFHIPGPTSRPYLTAEVQSPTQTGRLLSRPAKFVIIASNGLWDFFLMKRR
ncbi:probable protein phosphatase 2C 25 [Arachis stenosperma]|uniref:probable protein phosphatase 2C 25 n=1 Tax=Arachis stenosperma TaxID=217475 RepID=UPI0025AC014C|nr:probable protein phosphatase 2C 25 [Arachis stenosperma]